MPKKKKIIEVKEPFAGEDYGLDDLSEPKQVLTPLDLNLQGQLGQENLTIVVGKLNEVIAYLNK